MGAETQTPPPGSGERGGHTWDSGSAASAPGRGLRGPNDPMFGGGRRGRATRRSRGVLGAQGFSRSWDGVDEGNGLLIVVFEEVAPGGEGPGQEGAVAGAAGRRGWFSRFGISDDRRSIGGTSGGCGAEAAVLGLGRPAEPSGEKHSWSGRGAAFSRSCRGSGWDRGLAGGFGWGRGLASGSGWVRVWAGGFGDVRMGCRRCFVGVCIACCPCSLGRPSNSLRPGSQMAVGSGLRSGGVGGVFAFLPRSGEGDGGLTGGFTGKGFGLTRRMSPIGSLLSAGRPGAGGCADRMPPPFRRRGYRPAPVLIRAEHSTVACAGALSRRLPAYAFVEGKD